MNAESAAALRRRGAPATVEERTVLLAGYGAPGDGGGGHFIWDETATDPDDGGTTLDPHDGVSAQGRWRRVASGDALDVRWFGARGDGVHDDSDAFHRAINAACSGGLMRELRIPQGRYVLRDPLVLDRPIRVRGVGALQDHGSLLQVGTAGEPACDGIRIAAHGVILEDVGVISACADGTSPPGGSAARGVVICSYAVVSRVHVNFFPGDGFQLRGFLADPDNAGLDSNVDFARVSQCYARYCGNGFRVFGSDGNWVMFDGCVADLCGYPPVPTAGNAAPVADPMGIGWGIGFHDDSDAGCTFVGCKSEFGYYGPAFSNAAETASTFLGCYSEGGSLAFRGLATVVGGTFNSERGDSSAMVVSGPTLAGTRFVAGKAGVDAEVVPLLYSGAGAGDAHHEGVCFLATKWAEESSHGHSGYRWSSLSDGGHPYPPGWNCWGWNATYGRSFLAAGPTATYRGAPLGVIGLLWSPYGLVIGTGGDDRLLISRSLPPPLMQWAGPGGGWRKGDRVLNSDPQPGHAGSQRFAGWVCAEAPSTEHPYGVWAGYGELGETYSLVVKTQLPDRNTTMSPPPRPPSAASRQAIPREEPPSPRASVHSHPEPVTDVHRIRDMLHHAGLQRVNLHETEMDRLGKVEDKVDTLLLDQRGLTAAVRDLADGLLQSRADSVRRSEDLQAALFVEVGRLARERQEVQSVMARVATVGGQWSARLGGAAYLARLLWEVLQ